MRSLLRFIASAYGAGKAYIDIDGTIVRKHHMGDADINAWMDNLMPRPLIWRRLFICYLLHYMGVRLIIWTNRPPELRWGTMLSLGRHVYIFSAAQFHGTGRHPVTGRVEEPYTSKYDSMPTDGPVMDDHKDLHEFGGYPGSLHVRAL